MATLAARTEGWVAGLQMAALSLQGHIRTEGEDCVKEYVKGFGGGHRFIADYLDDIYHQQPGEIRDFLAQTAILDQLCPPLCDAVTGRSDSQSILAYLEQNNLFVVRLDDHRFWYRYHQLFLDYLRAALPPVKKGVPAFPGKDLARDLWLRQGSHPACACGGGNFGSLAPLAGQCR